MIWLALPRAARRPGALVSLAAAALVGAACSDPTLDVAITYQQATLVDHVDTLTVSVLAADAAGDLAGLVDANGVARAADCDDVALGRVPAAALDGARRTTVAAFDAPRLSGVPRLGDKLIFVEARSRIGRRVGAGCSRYGDVERDASVTVEVATAPRVHEFASLIVADQVTLIATAPWPDGPPLADYQVVAEVFGPGGLLSSSSAATDGEGLATIPILTGAVPGPTQTVLRVRWAPDLIRVSRFVPWAVRSAHAASSDRIPPRWVTGRLGTAQVRDWVAAAVHSRASDDVAEIEIVQVESGALRLDLVPAGPARALAVWGGRLITLLDDGWHDVDRTGISGGFLPDPGVAATELHVVTRCNNPVPLGLLVRRGVSPTYSAYDMPGAPTTTGLLTQLANVIGSAELADQLCIADQTGVDQKVVLVRSNGDLDAITPDGTRYELPAFTGVTDFAGDGGRHSAAGVAFTLSGPRVASYRLDSFTINGQDQRGLVPTDVVDVALAATPTSVVVHDLDGDGGHDVLAAIPTTPGIRIQAVLSQQVAGEPLTSLTSPVADTRGAAGSGRLIVDQIDPSGGSATDSCIDVIVLSASGVDVYSPYTTDAGGGEVQCQTQPPG